MHIDALVTIVSVSRCVVAVVEGMRNEERKLGSLFCLLFVFRLASLGLAANSSPKAALSFNLSLLYNDDWI